MLRWLLNRLRSIFFGKAPRRTPGVEDAERPVSIPPRSYPTIPLREHVGNGSPPRMHWKASHPSTIKRFKAEVTCSRGHGIVLRDHTVEANGRVVPSIVCKEPGCDFHEIVRLDGWRWGYISAKPDGNSAAA